MAASDIRAGGAYIELFTKDLSLQKGLQAASRQVSSFALGVASLGATMSSWGKKIMALGGLVTAPVLAASKSWSSLGEELINLHKKTGMSVEALSALRYTAEQTGTDFEGATKTLDKMNKLFTTAVRGSKESEATITALGLSVDQLSAMNVDERFLAFAEAISQIEDPSLRAGMAVAVFGRSGAEMLPIIEGGRAALEQFRQDAHNAGRVMSEEDAEAAATLHRAYAGLGGMAKSLGNTISSILSPALTGIANSLTRGIQQLRDWIDKHGDLVRGLFLGAIGAVAFGAGLFVAGKALSLVAWVISGVAEGLSLMAKGVGFVGRTLSTLAKIAAMPFELLATVVRGGISAALSALGTVARVAFRALSTAAEAAWNVLSYGVPAIARVGAAIWDAGWSAGKAVLWLGNNIGEAVKAFTRFGQIVGQTLGDMVELIIAVGKDWAYFANKIMLAGLSGFISLAAGAMGGIVTIGTSLLVVIPIAGSLISLLSGIGVAAVALGVGLAKIGGMIWDALGKLARGAVDGLRTSFAQLGDAFSGFGSFFSGWGDLAEKVFSDLRASFDRLKADGKAAFDALQAAFTVGDWSAIGKILVASFTIAWEEIKGVIGSNWDSLMVLLAKGWAGLWLAGANGVDWVLTQLKMGWASFEVVAMQLWVKISTQISKTLSHMADAMAKSGMVGREASKPLYAVAGAMADEAIKGMDKAQAAEDALPGVISGERSAFDARVKGRQSEAINGIGENSAFLIGHNPFGSKDQAAINAARAEIASIKAEMQQQIQAEKDKAANESQSRNNKIDREALTDAKGSTSQGTFNPFAIAGLGGGTDRVVERLDRIHWTIKGAANSFGINP